MEKKFVANKALLVNAQGKILFVRHAPHEDRIHSVGRWDVPGGRMNKGEHPLKGLVREVEEEIGVTIDPSTCRAFHTDLWAVANDYENHSIIGMFYIVHVSSIDIQLSGEHDEYFWYDPRQPLPDNTTDIIAKAILAYRKYEGIVTGVDDPIAGHKGFGLIQLYTGNGKGKTTAALGQMIRAVAIGKKVGIVYFDKGGDAHYSERKHLDTIEKIEYVATGRDRIDPVTNQFDFSIVEIDKKEAARGLKEVERMFGQDYDLVVMDEINSTVALGMISEDATLRVINQKPDSTELILTGRNAPDAFIKKAHLVSEMRLHKHYFYSGVPAREGLDY